MMNNAMRGHTTLDPQSRTTTAWRAHAAALASVIAITSATAMSSPALAADEFVAVDTDGDVGSHTSLQLDAAGNPVVSYYDATNGDLMLVHCNDPACAGDDDPATAVDTAGDVGWYTSLQLDALGNPVISYFDIDNMDLKLVHCNDPGCAGDDDTISVVDAHETLEIGFFTSLQLDAAGNPVISYYAPATLKLAHCNDPDCTGDDESIQFVDYGIQSPGLGGGAGQHSSLQLDAVGNPVIAYRDELADALILTRCNDPDCAGGDESIRPVDFGGAGYDISLQLNAAGDPVVSHAAGVNRALRLVRCDDPTCLQRSITAVDTAAVAGQSTSLALDASDNPVIAYHGAASGDLKLARCNDPRCLGDDQIVTAVDTSGDLSSYSSLKLDSAGHPVISYHDRTNGDLDLVHCDDPVCSPDTDGDGVDDIIDNCPAVANPDQADADRDGIGDACDPLQDTDGDGVDDEIDNCPGIANPDQDDTDADTTGDACDADTITVVDAADDVGRYTSLRLDATGNPVVSYHDDTNEDLKLVHCNDSVCQGDDESITAVDTAGDAGEDTSLQLDAEGRPVISSYRVDDGELRLARCNDADCRGDDEANNSVTTAGTAGQDSSLVLDAAGNPVISSHSLEDRDLVVVKCNDPECAGGDESITAVDDAGDVGEYTSLVLDAAGNPVVSYYDGSNGDLKLVHCNDPSCVGGDESIVAVDTSGNVGRHTSLQLDIDGYPVISYYDAGNGDLKVVHCNDQNCAGGDESTATVDSVGDVGEYSSLRLDADGYPVISYYDGTDDDLRLMHCNDPACAGDDESIVNVDTTGAVGRYTSLQLDADGHPVISYYSDSNRDLKLVHCDDPRCSPDNDDDGVGDDADNCRDAANADQSDIDGDGHGDACDADDDGDGVGDDADNCPAIVNTDQPDADGDGVGDVCDADTITVVAAAGIVGLDASLQLDGAGNPVIAHRDLTSGDLKLVRCNDADCAGSGKTTSTVDPAAATGRFSSLQLDAAGNPVISYRDDMNADLKLVRCNDPACVGGDETITAVDTAGDVGLFTSLQLDAGGRPVISYWDSTNSDLKLVHCNDPACVGGDESITAVDTAGLVGTHTSLQLDASGHPIISYHDFSNGDLKVVHCNDPDCVGDDEVFSAVDTTGNVGTFTSLQLDGVGNPVVAYFDVGNGDLKLVHCDDPTCGGDAEAITTLDGLGDVGRFNSLQLSESGNPVVSYYDLSDGDLKLIACNDPACVGGDETITAVDTAGDVGEYTSLRLDGAGNPVVAYNDVTNRDLKLVHCDDPACSSDNDRDGVGDDVDNCSAVANADQADLDGDGSGDACDVDDDGDGVLDEVDNCPAVANLDQADADGDGIGDVCDPLQDADGDGVGDDADNCPTVANEDQADLDADGLGDACDPDDDGDGVADEVDNCPVVVNADQADLDGDGSGDACDVDDDGDGVLDEVDNCPAVANPDQADLDGDGIGDVCDPLQDSDGDGVGDVYDNCPADPNPDQADFDDDGVGDACDPSQDFDGDDVRDDVDNCPAVANPDQGDVDGDGTGDVCDVGSTSVVDRDGDVGRFSSLQLDSEGRPVISYEDRSNDHLKVVRCNDPDCVGDDETISTADSAPNVGDDTSLQLDGDGHPVISHRASFDGDLRLVRCNDPACVGGDESIVTVDADGRVGEDTSLQLDGDGHPVISHHADFTGDLKLVRCNDPACVGGDESIVTVDAVGRVGEDSSLQIDGAGHPVISYHDSTNDSLKLVRCNDPACVGGDESIVTVDAAGQVGWYTSLQLDGDGHPVISYFDIDNGALKFVHCNDPACLGGDESIVTIDAIGRVGEFSSLQLDGDGQPAISYYDDDNEDLKLVRCNDPACLGGDESIVTVDAFGEVGRFTSLQLDGDGHPVISYFDGTNRDLKLVHCADPVCSPDTDGDGVTDHVDNCPAVVNADQADLDGDDVGDACDPLQDSDGDEVADEADNCPAVANPDQADADGDGLGDVCDPLQDSDGDGVADDVDNCPTVANVGQADMDGDGLGDACDPSPSPDPDPDPDPDPELPGVLTSLSPERFADSRDEPTFDSRFRNTGRRAGDSVWEIEIAGRGEVPADATAAIINVTAVFGTGPGFVTVFPCGTVPVSSSVNYGAGTVDPNEVIAKLSADGTVCIYTLTDVHIVVDVVGYTTDESPYVALAPARFADSRDEPTFDSRFRDTGARPADSVWEIDVAGRGDVPAGVDTVVMNITTLGGSSAGFVTVFPCGTLPVASSANYQPGEVVPNEVVAKLSADGTVCVYTLTEADIVIDVVGYVDPPSSYTSITPTRFADSRDEPTFDGAFRDTGVRAADGVWEIDIAGRGAVSTDATQAVINVTAVAGSDPGFLTVFPCGTVPVSSSVNYLPGQVVANELTAKLSPDGAVCIYTLAATDIIVDVVGHD